MAVLQTEGDSRLNNNSNTQGPAVDKPVLEAAIFDMDGLLVDTERFSKQAFQQTAQDYGLEHRIELFLSLVGTNEQTHRELLHQELEPEVDATRFRRDWVDCFHQLISEKPVPLLDGVQEVLEWLQGQNIKCAVATSSGTVAAEKKLRETGIRDFFQTVTCGDQVARSKPHPDIYLQAVESVGANASCSIGLEDSPNGVRAAVAAGLHVIQVPNLVQPDDHLLTLGHRVCGTMHEVLTLVQSGLAIPD